MGKKERRDGKRRCARKAGHAALRVAFLFGLILSAAQARPITDSIESPAAPAPVAEVPSEQVQAGLDAARLSGAPNGRLLPGLLLGLLLGIGAYHIGRQVYDNAPGSRGASALLVAGFAYEYAAFGLHEPLIGTGRASLILSALTTSGVGAAGVAFLSGFLSFKNKKRNGHALAVTRGLIAIAALLAMLAPLRPELTQRAAEGLLALALAFSLGTAVNYARQGDTRAAYLLPGLGVLAIALLGAASLLVVPGLSEAVLVPLLHGTFVIGLLVIAFAVTNAWNEPPEPYVTAAAPASREATNPLRPAPSEEPPGHAEAQEISRESPKSTSPEPATAVSVSARHIPTRARPDGQASLATELKRALEREELELCYRPIVSLADGRVSGFDVEILWRHARRGLVKASDLTRAAEEAHLCDALAKYALAMAGVQLYQWQAFFPLARALFAIVPITDPKLLAPELLANVRRVLSAAAIAPTSLRLELSEPALLSRASQVAGILSELKHCGVGIVLKAELASATALSTLERFPLDTVKIGCVASLQESTGEAKALRALIERARRLHMEIIAAGVESDTQSNTLRAQGCELAEGSRFGTALPSQEAQALIARFWSG